MRVSSSHQQLFSDRPDAAQSAYKRATDAKAVPAVNVAKPLAANGALFAAPKHRGAEAADVELARTSGATSGLPSPAMHRPPRSSFAPFSREFWRTFRTRTGWLVGLLILQSASSVILARYDELIEKHFVIALFLTMLVGAGGNAGNQSTVTIVRYLASSRSGGSSLGSWRRQWKMLRYEVLLGACVGCVLATVAWLRVYLTHRNALAASAISTSLLFVVVAAKLLGTAMPLAFAAVGVDPAHAAPAIQVAMDIVGVLITCAVSGAFLLRQASPGGTPAT